MCRNKNCNMGVAHNYLFGYCSGCWENTIEKPRLYDYEVYCRMYGAWGRSERCDTEKEALEFAKNFTGLNSVSEIIIMTFNRSNMKRETIHSFKDGQRQ